MSASRRHRARWPPRPTGGACEATSIPSCSRPCERILPGGIRRWKRCWMMSPVIAPACPCAPCPDSTAYRTRKFIARHRVGALASAAVLLALIAGLAGTIWKSRAASLEAAKEREVKAFLVALSGSPIRSPWLPDGRSPRPSCWNEAPGRSIRPWRHDRRFRPSCSTWSASSTAISGSISEPSPCSVARYNFPGPFYGDNHSIVAARSTDLASALLEQGRYAEAESLLTAALAVQRKALEGPRTRLWPPRWVRSPRCTARREPSTEPRHSTARLWPSTAGASGRPGSRWLLIWTTSASCWRSGSTSAMPNG